MDVELLSEMVDYGILGLLGFMSFLVLFFWIERLLFYRGVNVEEYSTQEALELDITNNLSIISSFGDYYHFLYDGTDRRYGCQKYYDFTCSCSQSYSDGSSGGNPCDIFLQSSKQKSRGAFNPVDYQPKG